MSKRRADLNSVGGILLGAALGALITFAIGSMREAEVRHYADVDNEVECDLDVTAAPSVAWSSSGDAVGFSRNGVRVIYVDGEEVVRLNGSAEWRERMDEAFRRENVDREREVRRIIVRDRIRERVEREHVAREDVVISPDGNWVVVDFDEDGHEDIFISADDGQVHCVMTEDIAERAEAEAKEAIARQFEEIDMFHFEDVARKLELAARQVAEQRDLLVFRLEGLEGGELDRAARELELKALQLHEIEGELEARLEAQLKQLEETLETEVERRKRRRRRPHEGG